MAEKFFPRLRRTFLETATSAAVWFPLGNTFLALDKAETTGILLMMATTALTTCTRAIASWQQSKSGSHFYILSAVNAYLAGSVLYHGIELNGLQDMITFATSEARGSMFSALALSGWSFCHYINGRLDTVRAGLRAQGRENDFEETGWENTRNLTNSVASMFAVRFNPEQCVGFAAGFARSLFNRASDRHTDGTLRRYAAKHVTPPRIVSTSYLLGAAQALADPFFAAAQCCWAAGQIAMEPERNRELPADTKEMAASRYRTLTKPLNMS